MSAAFRPGYRFVDHTADVGADLEAATLGGLYAEALAAFTDTLTVRERVEAREERRFELEAAEREALLVDWLDELLYLWEVEGWLFRDAEVEVEEAEGRVRLAARARGERYDPERHPSKVLIKGITWHGLTVEPAGQGWHGRVIFDI